MLLLLMLHDYFIDTSSLSSIYFVVIPGAAYDRTAAEAVNCSTDLSTRFGMYVSLCEAVSFRVCVCLSMQTRKPQYLRHS